MKKLLLVLVVGGAFVYWRSHQSEPSSSPNYFSAQAKEAGGGRAHPAVEREAANFQCDGRTRCREMRSCQEAEFFSAHCPGAKMDGDGDGIPCEDQLCG